MKNINLISILKIKLF